MTDHKFTDDDVIKALECCRTIDGNDCKNCAYRRKVYGIGNGGCTNDLVGDALALINRQKAENERLNTVHADMIESLRLAAEANKDMQAEVERLEELAAEKQNLTEQWKNKVGELLAEKQIIEAEAIKEFAQRLKAESILRSGCVPWYDIQETIDTLVKEMMEENK